MLVDYPDVECHAVSITAGESATMVQGLVRANLVARGQWRVSKVQLIGTIREVLEGRRFKVSKDEHGKPIEFAEVLVRELTNFRERITESANMTYEARQGQHDDIVLATALPCWIGSSAFAPCATPSSDDEERAYLQSRERTALTAEQSAIEAAELEVLKREREGRSLAKERLPELQKRRDQLAHENINDPFLG